MRFDDGHKQIGFVMDELVQWVAFKLVCSKMSIGLSVSYPVLCLVQTAQGNVHVCFNYAPGRDVTSKVPDSANSYLQGLGGLSGFIVYAKSSSCGAERVRLYDKKGNHGRKEGAGLFTGALTETYSWLPAEEDGRSHDPVLGENFVERMFTLHEFNRLRASGPTRHGLFNLHSRYKSRFPVYHQAGYRETGPFVVSLHQWDGPGVFFVVYREKFMTILKKPVSRRNHTNVLMRIQDYFRGWLNVHQRGGLRDVALNYSGGLLSILVPLILLKHYLTEYPDSYPFTQDYLDPYSNDLALWLTIK